MKNFIYVDTDFLSSFMSQENNGLETLRNIESNVYSKTLNGSPTTTQIESMSAEANAVVAKGSLNTQRSIESGVNITESSDLYKEMVCKILHDDMFECFQRYLTDNSKLSTNHINNESIGKYITMTGAFKIIDIDHIRKICDEKFLKNVFEMIGMFSTNHNSENINNYTQGKPKGNKSSKNNEIPPEVHFLSKIGPKLTNVFDVMIPSNTIFIMDNSLIIINDKYLREDVKMINFKYSGNINVTGIVNKVYNNTDDKDPKNKNDPTFVESLEQLNACGVNLITSLITKNDNIKEVYIITPIAIYF